MNEQFLDVANKNDVSYNIEIEDALNSLNQYLEIVDGEVTKSGLIQKKRTIKSVDAIKPARLYTKSVADSANCENLIYLVNFDNDQGYALLSADTRIPTDIISIVDIGSLTKDDLYAALDIRGREIFPEYPSTGSGVFYDADSTEMYMNPNTFSLYDAASNDSYVGNFKSEQQNLRGRDFFYTQRMINNLSIIYAIKEVNKDIIGIAIPPGGDTTVVTSVNKEITDSISNILSFAKLWQQGTPFNDYCPKL